MRIDIQRFEFQRNSPQRQMARAFQWLCFIESSTDGIGDTTPPATDNAVPIRS